MKPFIKYGLLAAVALLMIWLASYYMDLAGTGTGSLLDWIGYGTIAISIFMVLKERKLLQHGRLTYWQGMSSGAKTALIAALALSLAVFIHTQFIDTSVSAHLYNIAEEEIAKSEDLENMTDNQQEAVMSAVKMLSSPLGIAFISWFRYFVAGVVISFVIAAIARNETKPADPKSNGELN